MSFFVLAIITSGRVNPRFHHKKEGQLVVPYEEVLPKRDYSTSAGIGHKSFKSSKIGFNRLFAFNLNNSCDNRRNSFVPFLKGNRKISISNKKAISSTSQGERLPSQAYHRQSQERTGRRRANQILSFNSIPSWSQLPMSSESLTLRGRRATSIIPIVTRETEPK